MDVVQCGSHVAYPVSPVDQRHSFISYIPIAIRLVRPPFSRSALEAPHRRRRLKAQRPRVLSMSFRQAFITSADIPTQRHHRVSALRPVSGAFGGHAAKPSNRVRSNQFIGLSRRKCRTRIRRAGHGSKSACAQRSARTSIRAGLRAWTWKRSRKAPCGCRCRPGSSRAGSSRIMQSACWPAGRRRKTKSLASS